MEKSESIKNLASALCKFQREVGKVRKDAENPFYKSRYASLVNILDVIRTPLADNGLSFAQFPHGENGLTTILMHESGEFVEASYVMKPVKGDPQSLGSAITYQRRYALGAVLGLNIDEDDDANAASGRKPCASDDRNVSAAADKSAPVKSTPDKSAPVEKAPPKRPTLLTDDKITDQFVAKVARARDAAIAEGRVFSVLSFLEQYYIVTSDQAVFVGKKVNELNKKAVAS